MKCWDIGGQVRTVCAWMGEQCGAERGLQNDVKRVSARLCWCWLHRSQYSYGISVVWSCVCEGSQQLPLFSVCLADKCFSFSFPNS